MTTLPKELSEIQAKLVNHNINHGGERRLSPRACNLLKHTNDSAEAVTSAHSEPVR